MPVGRNAGHGNRPLIHHQPKGGRFFLHRRRYHEGSQRDNRHQKGELAQDINRSRAGRPSKTHAVAHESGRPGCLISTGGQVHDNKMIIDLLDRAGESTTVIAGRLITHGRPAHALPTKVHPPSFQESQTPKSKSHTVKNFRYLQHC
jgi:hypothetical protein